MIEPNLVNGNWEQTIAHYLQQVEPINGSWLQAIAYALANLPATSGETSFLSYTVTDYSTLIATATGATTGQFAYVENSQGTQWLPGILGGTYYGSGLYYYSGGIWNNDLPQIENQLYIDNNLLITGGTYSNGTTTLKNTSGGTFNITGYATKTSDLINDGDDGITHFISLNDLPSNIILYPTTVSSDIGGYFKLVSSINDPSYNTGATDVSTGAITGSNQLISSLATSSNIIVGNPGVFNITTLGNITRTSGTGTAEFYFSVFKRNAGGTETLIVTSNNTIPVVNTGYSEFSATGLWNDGDFLSTDRIVIKFYGTRIAGGSDPVYQFQFGGSSPVRVLVPIPLAVVPAQYVFTGGTVAGATNFTGGLTATTISATTYQGLPTSIGSEFIFITKKSDLPTASSSIITLSANKTYFFTTNIDLIGDRLVCGANTTILGASSENCLIKSTGLNSSTALISSNYSLPMRHITLTHGTALNLSGDSVTTALDWFGVNFTDCTTVGTIKNYSNFIMNDSAFLNSKGLTFDGSIGTIGMANCLFDCASGGTAITLASTLTVSRRFRVIYSSFVILSGETALNVSTGTTIGDEKYILDTVNFAGGGTYLTGLTETSNKSLFANCVGITNTSTRGFMYMINNTTDTTIGVPNTNVWVKALGTTTQSNLSKFTHTNNRLTYSGAFSQAFIINVNASVRSAGTNQVISIGVAKNGTILSESEITIRTTTSNQEYPGSTLAVTDLVLGDYVELFVKNTSSTDVRVSDLNFNVVKIPV